MSENESPRMMKIVVTGDPATGKTSLITRFLLNEFYKEPATIGSQFACRYVDTSFGYKVNLYLWEVMQRYRFSFARGSYLTGASGVIVVYDSTRESTFLSLPASVSEIGKALTGSPYAVSCPIAVAATKADLRAETANAVAPSRGAAYAEELSAKLNIPTMFLDTSAKTGQNVDRLFSQCPELILAHETNLRFRRELAGGLSKRVLEHGWHHTKQNLAGYDKWLVLDYLGFPELTGLQVTTEGLLSAIPNDAGFSEGIEALRGYLMAQLEEQIERGGPTFNLDIEGLAATQAARFVHLIAQLRMEEIELLAERLDSASSVNPKALWNTYYGRMMLESIGHPKDSDPDEVKELLQLLRDRGMPLRKNTSKRPKKQRLSRFRDLLASFFS